MSSKKIITSAKAPAAVGAYSQAVQAGDFLFVSGQLPLDPESGAIVGDDIETQTRQSIRNIISVLDAAGLTLADLVKTTVFLKDMGHFAPMNGVYQEFFAVDAPARACVEVAELPRQALVEIESIAYTGK